MGAETESMGAGDRTRRLVEFAERVLAGMEDCHDWDADMVDRFSGVAVYLGLADLDEYGYFTRTVGGGL